ncbi:hypothetical protein PY093_15570 [Cytobacillus sp. S13-E01]|uniref:hypothetical protein n=1 Tax=Cytobacillus sp. S13-E01 TaxID=3031326 RepID=UPI0023D7D50F|nr:hypothetical protein [Cytobacillus sp. S13-E01]MDF0728088.1 hypothetical protein [Cytobacillus sp. S13-E01]
MEVKVKILDALKYISGTILAIGLIFLSFGLLESGYNYLAPIGIGTIVGAVFIFLMGIFFVATEEMLGKMSN